MEGDEASLKPYSPLKRSCMWRRAIVSKENSPSSLRPQAPRSLTREHQSSTALGSPLGGGVGGSEEAEQTAIVEG